MTDTSDAEFAEKLRTISFSRARNRSPKRTLDVHDNHAVEVTEHWNDRQDVTVRNPEVTLNPALRAAPSKETP